MRNQTIPSVLVAGVAFIFVILLFACVRDSYTVIQRTNHSGNEFWVKVVLLHDGHRFYTICNNYKAAGNYKPAEVDKVYQCGLHVGQTVRCKFFPHRESGYDLICGNELVQGELTTSGRNDLLLIEKEE